MNKIICAVCEKPNATIKDKDFHGIITYPHYYNQIRGKVCKRCFSKMKRKNKQLTNEYRRRKLEWYKYHIKKMKGDSR